MIYRDSAFARYTPAHADVPEQSELTDDWYVFWSLARRLGVELQVNGVPLNMEELPTTDDILALIAGNCELGFSQLQQHSRGAVVNSLPQYAEPAEPGWTGRFTLMPEDVRTELSEVAEDIRQKTGEGSNEFRLAVRRLRETFNSVGRDLPATRKRQPFNRAYLNPQDMTSRGISRAEEVVIRSAHGEIMAVAEPDPTVRRRVVSIAHGFGGLPDTHNNRGYYQDGVSTNLLLADVRRETINAMPRMTGLSVHIERKEQQG